MTIREKVYNMVDELTEACVRRLLMQGAEVQTIATLLWSVMGHEAVADIENPTAKDMGELTDVLLEYVNDICAEMVREKKKNKVVKINCAECFGNGTIACIGCKVGNKQGGTYL